MCIIDTQIMEFNITSLFQMDVGRPKYTLFQIEILKGFETFNRFWYKNKNMPFCNLHQSAL